VSSLPEIRHLLPPTAIFRGFSAGVRLARAVGTRRRQAGL